MFYTKLCLVLIVLTISGRCQGTSGNSSPPPPAASPPPPAASPPSPAAASRRMPDEPAAALRRQLMRDNYDYTLSEDERKYSNVSDKRDETANIYYQKDATDHLAETAELSQTDSASEHAQYEQDNQQDQAGQYQPHRFQGERPSQYGHQGQRGWNGQEQPNEYIRAKDPGRAWSEREHLEQQGRFLEQKQVQYEEKTDRAKPSYADELTERELQPQYPPDHRDPDPARRHIEPQMARETAYNPTYHKKHREAFDPYQAQPARPFSDLRGDFREQYGQNDAAKNTQFNPEEQEAFDQQNISDSQDDGSDYSESKGSSREMYNAFGHTNRARLQHYTRPSAARIPPHRGRGSLTYQDPNASPDRNHYALPGRNHHGPMGRTHHMPPGSSHHAPPGRSRHAGSGRNYQAPAERNYQDPSGQDHNAPLDHNISKKDLLYYMDDTQLRRHNNAMSPDVHDEEVAPSAPSPQPSANPSSLWASPTSSRANPVTTKLVNPPSTERGHRSFVVTVSPNNVTYKLLTLKTREGRRRGERRILEERRPGGVAIISLDHAPLPAFRLPRSRRQYMHDHHHRRQ